MVLKVPPSDRPPVLEYRAHPRRRDRGNPSGRPPERVAGTPRPARRPAASPRAPRGRATRRGRPAARPAGRRGRRPPPRAGCPPPRPPTGSAPRRRPTRPSRPRAAATASATARPAASGNRSPPSASTRQQVGGGDRGVVRAAAGHLAGDQHVPRQLGPQRGAPAGAAQPHRCARVEPGQPGQEGAGVRDRGRPCAPDRSGRSDVRLQELALGIGQPARVARARLYGTQTDLARLASTPSSNSS